MIATAIVVGITLHAGNHLACDFPRVIASGPEEYRLVAGAFGASKPTYGRLISGVEGVTGIAMDASPRTFTHATPGSEMLQPVTRYATSGGEGCYNLPFFAGTSLLFLFLLQLVFGFATTADLIC